MSEASVELKSTGPGGVEASEEEYRFVDINNSELNAERLFCSNVVVTSKYSLVSFLPKFLFETFRKLANFYFLIVSIMQTIKPISNTDGFPATLPTLMFIVGVDAMFAVLEDLRRHKSDSVANGTICHRFENGAFRDVPWRRVVVGDILKINNYDVIPADVMIISSSTPGESGICYVETKSLDGETNLKLRQGMEPTVAISTMDHLSAMVGQIKCEVPNNAISKFTGTLTLPEVGGFPIPPTSMLLRGCTLRNTDYVYGVVVNTGKDTKIMQAATATPSKWSSIEKDINTQLVRIVGVLVLFCFVGACANAGWNNDHLNDSWYLQWKYTAKFEKWVIQFFYYFLLMYQFIPVSLYVSMSTVKFIQAIFMSNDLSMYHVESDTPALVRTMSLNEELGQIEYIFSDKTGTLTCNVMDFRKCSINGVSYGHGTTEIGMAALRRLGKEPSAADKEAAKYKSTTPYVNFHGPELFADLNEGAHGPEQRQFISNFFTHLAVCHTVVAESLENGEVRLSASSPDEQALVSGAKFFGYAFNDRSPGKAHILLPGGGEAAYEILDVLEFNSTRKRMSVVVRDPNGKLLLYSKGADAVMWPLIASSPKAEEKKLATMKHMEDYAGDGLRTLAIAMREVPEDFYRRWGEEYKDACGDLEQIELRKAFRPNRIDELMCEMEADLTLLGATAIEDKLQDGVPSAVAKLAEAGIKIWVLTGDKEETAINIGFACQLLDNGMDRVVINMRRFPSLDMIKKELDDQSRRAMKAVEENNARALSDRVDVTWALVIDGEALELALTEECRYSLLRFAQYCKAVVACRVSPAQKAYMVELVRFNITTARTLAIGDGANDVAMIQSAHIGVGISGQEGMQAVNASDYAIAQFRFLQPLLLVHGRYNYRRMSKLVVYMFHKNIVLTLVQFIFTLHSGGSGQKWYAEWGVQLYNLMYTALPILLIGVLDKDVDRKQAEAVPRLYRAGAQNEFFNQSVFWGWMVAALYEAMIIYFIPTAAYVAGAHKGEDIGVWEMGSLAFSLVIIVCNAKLVFNQYSFLWFTLPVYVLSILAWFASGYIISANIWLDWNLYGVFPKAMQMEVFWLSLPLVLVLTVGRDFAYKGWKRMTNPQYYHLVQEVTKLGLPPAGLEWTQPEPPLRVVECGPPLAAADPDDDVETGAGTPEVSNTEDKSHRSGSAVNRLKRNIHKVILANRFAKSTGFAFSNDTMTGAAEARLLTASMRGEKSHDIIRRTVNSTRVPSNLS